MQAMMNHRFGLYILKEVFSTREQQKKTPPSSKTQLSLSVSVTAVEGVFKRASDSFLQHAYSWARLRKHAFFLKAREYCTQSGGARRTGNAIRVSGRP